MTEKHKNFNRSRRYALGWAPLDRVARPYLKEMAKQYGAAVGALALDWPHIVGDFFASQCYPQRLYFTKGQRGNGSLKLLVLSQFAHEFPFYEKPLMDKINAHFGYRAIATISTRQVYTLPAESRKSTPAKECCTEEITRHRAQEKKLYDSLNTLADDKLRAALAEFGAHLKKKEESI